ncbi:MAG: alkaline shock response membrane anchor protein AmaP [Anaerolineae bacterium]
MNVFNRIVVVLGIVALLAMMVFVVLFPVTTAAAVTTARDAFTAGVANETVFTFVIAGGIVLGVVLLVLLWAELRSPRRRTVLIRTNGKSDAHLGVDSVIQELAYRIDELPGVLKVQPHVRSRGRDVDVALDVDTSPSVNIPTLSDQITDVVHESVENQLGLVLHGQVRVNIRHEPYPRGAVPGAGAAPTQPLYPTPAPEPARYAPPVQQAPAPQPSVARTTPKVPSNEPSRTDYVRPEPIVSEPAPASGYAPDLTPAPLQPVVPEISEGEEQSRKVSAPTR